MQIESRQFGVTAFFAHVCGHSPGLFYAGAEFAQNDRARMESTVCLSCRCEIGRQDSASAQQERRRHPTLRQFPVNPDPQLPQPGDYYANGKDMVRVELDAVGQYWLRRVPDTGVVYQTWIRDQVEVQKFLAEREFTRVSKH